MDYSKLSDEEYCKLVDNAGERIGFHLLTQLDWNPNCLEGTKLKCKWDGEYDNCNGVIPYFALLEFKMRDGDEHPYYTNSFHTFYFREYKFDGMKDEIRRRIDDNNLLNVNECFQIQIFPDGFHIINVTKMITCHDSKVAARKHKSIDRSMKYDLNTNNDYDYYYYRWDYGFHQWKFNEIIPFDEMIHPDFNEKQIIIIKL